MTGVRSLSIKARARIVAEARRWIGTPYRHQASLLGAGVDCLGLVRGVWRNLCGPEPVAFLNYTEDWGEASGNEVLLDGLGRHFVSAGPELQAGQVLVFRMRERAIAKHVGILTEPEQGACSFVHAYSRRSVIEAPLNASWQRRLVATFEFPLRRA